MQSNTNKNQYLMTKENFKLASLIEDRLSKTSLIFSTIDQVNKVEVLQSLRIVNQNLSFASTWDDTDWFRFMFLDSTIPKLYRMSDTKAQCQGSN